MLNGVYYSMTLFDQLTANVPSSDILARTLSEEGEIVLNRAKLAPTLSRMHVVCAEAYAELGEHQKALVHLRQTSNKFHDYDRNLLAIASCLRKGGYDREAGECAESAMRIARRKFREADFCHGAIGELSRTYAMAAIVENDKRKVRNIKRIARTMDKAIGADLEHPDYLIRITGRAYDLEGVLAACGTIWHGNFKKQAEKLLDIVALSIVKVLIYPAEGTPTSWLKLGNYAALLFHQMGRQQDAEEMGEYVARAEEILFLDEKNPNIGDCIVEEESDDDLEDALFDTDILDPIEINDRIKLFREQSLIGSYIDVPSMQLSAYECIEKSLDLLDDEEEESITNEALKLYLLAVESEITKDLTSFEKEMLLDQFEESTVMVEKYLETISTKPSTIHPAEISELGSSIALAYNSLVEGLHKERLKPLIANMALVAIDSLKNLDCFLTVSQFISLINNSVFDEEVTFVPEELMNRLIGKAREISKNHQLIGEFMSDSPELIGGALDEALDLDTNCFLIQTLASMRQYAEARALAECTVGDRRLKNRKGSHLDVVWIDYLTGVFQSIEAPIIYGKGIEALPKTDKHWLEFRV